MIMKKHTKNNNCVELGIIIGISLGVALGIVFDKLAFLLPVGVGVGLTLGIIFSGRNHNNDE